MLTFAEEIILLTLDDESGIIKELPRRQLDRAMAGAVLMELALMNRIDCDYRDLYLMDAAPTGDDSLDAILMELDEQSPPMPIMDALNMLEPRGKEIRDTLLSRLVQRGILKQENRRLFWVFERRRYPVIDDHEIEEVKSRLRGIIMSDTLPDPRDAVLISLVDACGLFNEVFTLEELKTVCARIKQLARLDFIGQKLAGIVRPIQSEIMVAMAAYAPSCGHPL